MNTGDILIIGGGLAGAAAALQLAKAGRDVVVFEKEKGPHHKVCGEFINLEAQQELKRLDIDLQALRAEPIARLRLIHRNRCAETTLTHEGRGLSRFRLDEELLARAGAAGAKIVRSATVNDFQRRNQLWQVDCGSEGSWQAKNLFLATGKHDLRRLRRTGAQNEFIGFKIHLALTASATRALRGSIDLMLFEGGYAGLQPIEEGNANLCLVVDKARFAKIGREWDALLSYLRHEIPTLAERLDGSKPLWPRPLAIFGIPYGFVADRKNSDAHLYPLGDQIAVIPSVTGQGMSIALKSARMAVECHLEPGARAYRTKAWRCFSGPVRRATVFSQLIGKPAVQAALLALCARAPRLINAGIYATRLKT